MSGNHNQWMSPLLDRFAKLSRHRLVRSTFWVAFVAIAAWIVHSVFFPIPHYYLDDDWFVLPERAWFDGAWDWFKHLLFFSQQRLTWVGDFMLYRPGLFGYIWFQDVAFQHERVLQQWSLVVVAGFALASFVTMIRREWGTAVAISAALFTLCTPTGSMLFTWPHINGYLLAIALYTFAATRLTNRLESTSSALVTAVLFFGATLFHEFVALTLGLLVVIEVLFWRRHDRAASTRNLLALGLPIVLYFAIVGFGTFVLDPPRFFAPGETDGFVLDFETMKRIAFVQLNVTLVILHGLVPFASDVAELNVARLLVGAGIVIAAVGIWLLKPARRWSYKIAVCAAPFAVLFFGLLVGRVATRGVVKAHYYPMFQFFLLLFLLLVAAPRTRVWSRNLLVVLFLAGSLWSSRIVRAANETTAPRAMAVHRVVESVVEVLGKEKDRCYGGLHDAANRGSLVYAVSLALRSHDCQRKPGVRPLYFEIRQDESLGSFDPIEIGSDRARVDFVPLLRYRGRSGELASFLEKLTYNIFEAERNLRHDGWIELRSADVGAEFDVIEARFEAREEWPVMYNSGFFLGNASARIYVLLRNNMVHVLFADSRTPAREVAGVPVGKIKSEYSVRFERRSDRCLVYFDEMMLVQSPVCWQGPVTPGALEFSNATAPEKLIELVAYGKPK